jgi:hypothetical protein
VPICHEKSEKKKKKKKKEKEQCNNTPFMS